MGHDLRRRRRDRHERSTQSPAAPGAFPEPGGSGTGSNTGPIDADVSGVYTIRLSKPRVIGEADCSQQNSTLTIAQRGRALTFKSGGDSGTGRINKDLTFTGTILGEGVTETMDGSFTVRDGGRITIHASDVLDLESAACESTLDGERQAR